MITPEQCRAARAWLDMTQQTLAAASGVSHSAIKDFEGNKRLPIASNAAAIEKVFKDKGVQFINDGTKSGLVTPSTLVKPPIGKL